MPEDTLSALPKEVVAEVQAARERAAQAKQTLAETQSRIVVWMATVILWV